MPYLIRKKDDEHCVYKEGEDGEPTGESLGCHATSSEAEDQMAALYADEDEMKSDTVRFPGFSTFKCYKSADGKQGVVEAPGIIFDNTGAVKDLDNQYFTDETYLGQRDGDGVDATLNHRFPIITKSKEANELLQTVAKKRFTYPVRSFRGKEALVGQHILDLRDDFEKWVFDMCEQKALSWSTGTASHMASWDKTGKIADWPIIEWAYTPTPAQPLNPKVTPVKSLKDVVYENISLQIDSGKEGEEVGWWDLYLSPWSVSVTVPRENGDVDIWLRVSGEEEDITDNYLPEEDAIKVTHPATSENELDDKGAADARLRFEREIMQDQISLQQLELDLIGE